MIPEEIIKISLMVIVIIVAFTSIMYPLSQEFDRIDNITRAENIEDIATCQFEPTHKIENYFRLPAPRNLFRDLFPRTGEYDYYDGTYFIDRSGDIEKETPLVGFGTHNLILTEGSTAGGYRITLIPNHEVTIDNIEIIALMPKEDQTITINVETLEMLGGENIDFKSEEFKYKEVFSERHTTYVMEDINLTGKPDRPISITFLLSSLNEVEDQFEEAPRIQEVRINHLDDVQRETELSQYITCTKDIVNAIGDTAFINTGITPIDVVFSVFGVITYIISFIITAFLTIIEFFIVTLPTLSIETFVPFLS